MSDIHSRPTTRERKANTLRLAADELETGDTENAIEHIGDVLTATSAIHTEAEIEEESR